MMNAETNAIEANYLDKALGTEQERDTILKKLLNKKTITLATDTITQYNDNTDQFESKLLYFMPYIPVNHSRLKPTVTTYNTSIPIANSTYDVDIEIIIVDPEDENYCRYLTISEKTINMSMSDIMDSILSDECEVKKYFKYHKNRNRYIIDGYDAIGKPKEICFRTTDDIRNSIVSMRITRVDIVEENLDENKK